MNKKEVFMKKISILGDSLSTFYSPESLLNSCYHGDNEFYYPRYSQTIKKVEQTWWYQAIKNNNFDLLINNSLSGSSAYGTTNKAGMSDERIESLFEKGLPDIIFIYLGTNDIVNGHSIDNFELAIKTIINKIIDKSPKTYIYLFTFGYSNYHNNVENHYFYNEESRILYNNLIIKLHNEYKTGIIRVDKAITIDNYFKYLGDNLHYNADGAKLLCDLVCKQIKNNF